MKFTHTKSAHLFLVTGFCLIMLSGCSTIDDSHSEEIDHQETSSDQDITESLTTVEIEALSGIAPELQSGTPVIYLADNLGEAEKLGWCIDTEGREFADTLQAHSCKPANTNPQDTQFSYHRESGQIRSVPYSDKCVSFSDPENETWPFGLLNCVEGEPTQKFIYDTETQEIQIGVDPSQCITVARALDDAGPYVSRDLIYAPCDSLDPGYKQWVIKD